MADRYPYYGHDRGIVVTQPRPGKFEQRTMTVGELAAREPALQIAKDIYRHANQAGVCYFEIWRLIANAVDGAAPSAMTAALIEAKDLQIECLRLVLAAVSAKANVDSGLLVDMLRQAEEELKAKRWLS